ncbi:hypothetical protein [Streptomyces capitiformicae]|uniref:Uncharacterized protein n=1 Tax=Streptomyces capitiformicae TaxID=2014920 RepID=A0A919DKA8_9ACTN|nr:hypothetical protein [Streptomyces capitiformicae]GHE51684.1 hypothetical protein GCM10017771_73990 [Streptomyces capitiformicae]
MTNEMAVIVLGVGLVLVAASMIAAGAGYLARRDGASYPAAVTRAGAALAATLTVVAAATAALAALTGR